MRILIVTTACPYPMLSGGKIRVYNLIKRLAEEHEVWLATFAFSDEEAQGLTQMQKICRGVIGIKIHKIPRLGKLLGYLKYTMRGIPFEHFYLDSEDFTHELSALIEKIDFDILHMLPSSMGIYLDRLSLKPSCKCILGFYDVTSNQYNRITRIQRDPYWQIRNWFSGIMMQHWEPQIIQRFDRCEVVSEFDKNILQRENPMAKIDVIPNGVDTQEKQPLPRNGIKPAILFVGLMSYPPNTDAAIFFCNEILPSIKSKISNIETWIVGADPPLEVKKLDGEGVHVTGQVMDIEPYYQSSSICVVPLRAGSGTRLKILEAMALGRPVVSTSIGCEGLDVVDGQHILIADNPDQFAKKVVSLLTDKVLYRHIVSEARQFVVTKYDWKIIADRLMQIYTELITNNVIVLH